MDVCGKEEVFVARESLMITLNYRISDDTVSLTDLQKYGVLSAGEPWTIKLKPELEGQSLLEQRKQRITPERPEQEELYTESPVIEINNMERFKQALYRYVTEYCKKESSWTRPLIADDWKDCALYTMATIWTSATRQDFSNPIDFLERYTDFLTQDQWEDLRTPKIAMRACGLEIFSKVMQSMDERETPNQFCLFMKEENGRKHFFPSVCYGIQGDKAYVCAIHNLYGKTNEECAELAEFRGTIRGRGTEPLAIVSLIAFIQEAKARGIHQIIMPDNFIMQYTSKNRIQEHIIDTTIMGKRNRGEDYQTLLQELRAKKEQRLDSNHRGSLNNRLMTLMNISRFFSTGLRFIEIPGDVSDNLTVDIQNFQLARDGMQIGIPRKKVEDRQQDEESR